MRERERIIGTVFRAIDEMNELLPLDRQLEKSLNTGLFQNGGCLTSLELVNLIVATEQIVEDEFHIPVLLADEKAMSQENSPFRTVASFVEYITLTLYQQASMPNGLAVGAAFYSSFDAPGLLEE
jgi:D-alanine--poly(phosphoribitol) ligase subunit 2